MNLWSWAANHLPPSVSSGERLGDMKTDDNFFSLVFLMFTYSSQPGFLRRLFCCRLRMSVQVSALTPRGALRTHVWAPAAHTLADVPTGLCLCQRPPPTNHTTTTTTFLLRHAALALCSVTSTKARASCCRTICTRVRGQKTDRQTDR